ncbi:NAC domain-containing protein 53-like isoform X2 [Diospyros lotus]|uniref:NAC domain-containing protein 53-like isoform X2 n=1 Tax=Diospyros lotus TaxID=55363 RepID=UPI00225021BF|nr:NAC domain-containing protein 53-like isoform X2 [Diospyros lotus]
MGLDPSSAEPPTASLAPGFRFHPTDEELVQYYLKRKICGKPFRFDAISVIDIYKSEPWDLPGRSRLKSRDLEWYFFSVLDKKYGNGSKTNRATERGYWKTTGKDRPVLHRSWTVGMKKTLVYHIGRAPRGERTNWVMHEYKLVDEELERIGAAQDAFVLCRIFQKSGSGPKNGEQYGAPFVEEEWEDDELVMVPGLEVAEEVVIADDAYLDGDDLEQILDAEILSDEVPVPSSFYYVDNNSHTQEPVNLVDDTKNLLVVTGENYCPSEQPDGQILFDLPVQNDMNVKPVKHEYIGEPSNTVNTVDIDYLLDEPFLDASSDPPFDEGAFLETNDLSNPIEADPSGFDMLDEYLTFLGAGDDDSQYLALDSLEMMIGSENLVSGQAYLPEKDVDGGGQQETPESQKAVGGDKDDVASTSKKEPGNFESDYQKPFIKQASCMLENIPAPPAFASEFPSKTAALQLNSASDSSSSVHVTAGMIQIRNITLTSSGTHWSLGKHVDVNIIFSLDLPQNVASSAGLEPMAGLLLGKAGSRSWFYLIFFWVLILSVSFKIGSYIYTGNASR